LALGTLGALFTGGENKAIDIIRETIDRDVDAQKENLKGKHAALAARSTLMGHMRQNYDDEEAAALAVRGAIWDALIRRVDAMGASAAGDDGKQRAAAFRQQLVTQRTVNELTRKANAAQTADAILAAQMRGPAPKKEGLPPGAYVAKGRILQTPEGPLYVRDNRTTRAKMQELEKAEKGLKLLDQLDAAHQEFGITINPWSAARARSETIMSEFKAVAGVDPPDPTEWHVPGSPVYKAQSAATRGLLMQEMNHARSELDATPVEVLGTDAKGERVVRPLDNKPVYDVKGGKKSQAEDAPEVELEPEVGP
jgi:hypothetical protein